MITGDIMRISDGAKEMNTVILDNTGSGYEVVDTWTTINGQWYVTDNQFSIPQWAIDEYAIAGELGGAHHLFVRVLNKEGEVDFNSIVSYRNNTLSDERKIQEKDGFANIPVYNSFHPEYGENGGWESAPVVPGNTKYLVQGGGLPNNHHVSLFTVYRPKSTGNGNGNGNGTDSRMEVWLPTSKTTVVVHTNGHDFKMEVTK